MAGDARPKTVVLLSMGYDSLSTWHQLGRPSAVHFDVGSRYTRAERTRYEKLRASFPQLLPVQDLSWLGAKEESDAWVPLRNLLMTVHAAALGFNDIVMSAPCGLGGRQTVDVHCDDDVGDASRATRGWIPSPSPLQPLDEGQADRGHTRGAPRGVRLFLLRAARTCRAVDAPPAAAPRSRTSPRVASHRPSRRHGLELSESSPTCAVGRRTGLAWPKPHACIPASCSTCRCGAGSSSARGTPTETADVTGRRWQSSPSHFRA